MSRLHRFPLLLLPALLALACSAGPRATPNPTPGSYPGWPPNATDFELIPVPVTTEITVGSVRMLVNLLDDTNKSVAAPDRPVTLNLYDLGADPVQPAVTAQATYMTTIAALPGLYRATVNFNAAGAWGLEAITTEAGGAHRTGRMIFEVRETGTTPALGASAPASDTPTATDAAGIAALSTDDDADPDFYTTSVADALTAHEPFVLVFATPAFCTSATCGPTLDVVKQVAADYKGPLTFIHVEPYQLQMTDGHLQPVLTAENLPITVPAVDEWGLPTEPYVFVVDAAGKVSAKFEGIAAEDELRAAIDAVAGS
ncbi:MAG: hypothetical protein ABI797_06265 [Chloroflexota bacterium]